MTNPVIIDSIRLKLQLRVEYKGFHRIVEPHTYGVNDLNHSVLSCFQVAGGSKSNAPQGWKLLLVHEAHAISMTGTSFPGPRRDYVRNTSTMQRIYAQL